MKTEERWWIEWKTRKNSSFKKGADRTINISKIWEGKIGIKTYHPLELFPPGFPGSEFDGLVLFFFAIYYTDPTKLYLIVVLLYDLVK